MTVIDAYLDTVPAEQRVLLQGVREEMMRVLQARSLEYEEAISYGLPCLKVAGKAVGGFAANAKFCSYYPFSGSLLGELSSELTGYSQTKSALHFTEAKPLTPEVIEQLIATRLEQILH